MGRGIGAAQRVILEALEQASATRWALTTAQLAERTGRSQRQIRTAVDSLEQRRLVTTSREHIGWKGHGEYGSLTTRPVYVFDADGEKIHYAAAVAACEFAGIEPPPEDWDPAGGDWPGHVTTVSTG